MLLIDRYLISSWLKHFLIILGFFIAMLVAKEAYNYFSDLLREQFSLIKIFDFIIVSIFSDVFVLIPVTLFVSIILTFITLQKSNQIAILKSSGLSLFRISASFFLVATIIAILGYIVASFFITNITNKRNSYLQILEPNKFSYNNSNTSEILTYQNDLNHRLWYIEGFNASNSQGEYTILYQMNQEGVEVRRIIAKKSVYDSDLDTWTFMNGTEIRFDEITRDPVRTIPFATKQYVNLEENPEDFLLLDEEISLLSLEKVKKILSILPENSNQRLKYEIKYHSFYASPLLSIILVGISIPFLTSGVRNNSMLGPLYAFILLSSFFVTKSLTIALGLSYELPAIITAFLPYIIFGILSLKLYWQK